MKPLYDMHCHLDFADNAQAAAQAIAAAGAGVFSATVTPQGYHVAREEFATHLDVRVGLGLHPWWIADGSCGDAEIEEVLTLLPETSFVGEIGLDFGKQHGQLREQQMEAFERIVARCVELGGKTLTIHSVKAAREVLDILEKHRAPEKCACILHWYSGPTDQLWRAIELSCYFSMGAFMLRTGRGQEYAKLIPPERLLLETDEPPHTSSYDFAAMQQQMEDVLTQLEAIKAQPLRDTIAATSRHLLQLDA